MKYEKELRELFYMEQVYATLFSVFNKVQAAGNKAFDTLSSRQYMTILGILHLPKNEANLNNIAKKLGTTKQNVRQIINVLEKNNYVEVNSSKKDKRAVNIEVTEAGFQEMIKCAEPGIMFMADIFKEFTEDDLQVLWKLLKKLYRFDGEEQDGFESDVSVDDGVSNEDKEKILKRFVMKRNENSNSK